MAAEATGPEPATWAGPDRLLVWKRIGVQGRTVHYGEAGEGVPLVFLHGWGLSNRTYRSALKRLLGHDVKVVAPALPGFGGSAPLPGEEFTLAGYARWLADFCAAVGIDEPSLVLGHSFGGGVAIKFAHDHPERVRMLVLVNSIGGSVWSRSGSIVRSMAERPLWDWGLHLPRDLLPLRQVTRVLPVLLQDALPNVIREPRTVLRAAGLARDADLTTELEELKRRGLPIVVLWGEQDRILPRASLEALCEAAGDPECVTVPGNHSWLLADPDAFGEVMTNVIDVARRAREQEMAEAAFGGRVARRRLRRRRHGLPRLGHAHPRDETPEP